jgi:hypothetical protein
VQSSAGEAKSHFESGASTASSLPPSSFLTVRCRQRTILVQRTRGTSEDSESMTTSLRVDRGQFASPLCTSTMTIPSLVLNPHSCLNTPLYSSLHSRTRRNAPERICSRNISCPSPPMVQSILPHWLARHNKTIFGTIFVVGELCVLFQWFILRR